MSIIIIKKYFSLLRKDIFRYGALLIFVLLLVSMSLFGSKMVDDKSNSSSLEVNYQNDQRIKQYQTVFFDNFEKLDRNTWTFHSQIKPASGGMYKSRFKTNEENVYVDQGLLVLDCSKTANNSDGTYKKSNGEIAPVEYLAPYISTCDRLAMSEGRISARIKVSKGIEDGMFPFCFWTFGQNCYWPCAHEMDIMEACAGVSLEDKTARDGTFIPKGSHVSTFTTHLFLRTSEKSSVMKEDYLKLNWTLYNQNKYDRSIDFINAIDPTTWHVYCVEWNKKTISYFVDGKPIANYDAETLGAINANGEIGFFYPQDIRFNIKAGEATIDQHGYMFIDWVKAEALDNVPCTSIAHKDVLLKKGDIYYINPTFNAGCSNMAFSAVIKDDGILAYKKYLNDASQMVAHKILGRKTGNTVVTLYSADGKAVAAFKVRVI